MKIRRFYGKNIRVALRQVTEEFGEDAAILSNKVVPGGVEVIAALDYDESLMPANKEKIPAHPVANDDFSPSESRGRQEVQTDPKEPKPLEIPNRLTGSEAVKTSFSEQILAGIKSRGDGREIPSQSNQSRPSIDSVQPMSEPRKIKPIEWSMDPSLQAMREELGLMRSMMAEQLRGINWQRFIEKNPVSAMVARRLASLGLNANIVDSLLPLVASDVDAECAWQQVMANISKSMTANELQLLETGGIFAMVGPTGVGKTTTIAKLAARFVIKHGIDSVALITTDNYRISAFEQLSTLGKILQLPTAKVSDQQSLDQLLTKFASKKLILIDTAGVSTNDQQLMQQFKLLNSAKKRISRILLMSAACQGAALNRSVQLFSESQLDGFIVTKLDEAASLGDVMSILIQANLPILYTTDGQKIPEDIRVARPHHLVAKAVWLANKNEIAVDDWQLAQSSQAAKIA